MRVSSNVIGVKGDECQCGRRATVVHCPVCGSTRRYARSNRLHKMLDGSEKFVRDEFRCMTCGHLYIDEERILCEAPPIGTVLAQQKVKAIYDASKTGEYLSPKETKIAKTLDNLVNETNLVSETTEQQKLEADKKLDFLLRQAWADEVFAFKSGKSTNDPGPCAEYVERRVKELSEQQSNDILNLLREKQR
jgi:hypothetical protein